MLNQTKTLVLMLLALLFLSVMASCESRSANQAEASATSEPTKAADVKTPFERDLQFIRNGQFAHVWVFSRTDGKAIDRDDAAYLRLSAPQVVDWATTDAGKRVIAGTNFDLEKGNLPQLRKRFVVEDYTGK